MSHRSSEAEVQCGSAALFRCIVPPGKNIWLLRRRLATQRQQVYGDRGQPHRPRGGARREDELRHHLHRQHREPGETYLLLYMCVSARFPMTFAYADISLIAAVHVRVGL